MRTYEEMFQNVLVRRDAYRAAQAVRRQRLRFAATCGAAAMLCCLLTVAGMQFAAPGRLPTLPPVPDTTIVPTEATEATEHTQPPSTEATIPTEAPAISTETQATEPAETNAEAAPTMTEPAQTEPAKTEQPAVSDPPVQTEAPEPVTDAPASAAPTEAPEPVTEVLSEGFVIEHLAGAQRIVCMDAFPKSTGTLQRCELHSDKVELVEFSEADTMNEYRIRPVGQDTEFTVTQQEYEDFSLTVNEDAEISVNISLGRRRGFFILEGDTCTLYWFEGSEGFCVSGADTDLQSLLAISRSLVPAEQ